MKRPVSDANQTSLLALMAIAFAAATILPAGCNDAHPLYGPDTPRNGATQPVDPVYGTPLPGTGYY